MAKVLRDCTMTSQGVGALRLDKPLPRVVEHDSMSSDGSEVSEINTLKEAKPIIRWKPITLRPAFLLCLAALSVSLIIALQLLSSKSQRDGGILFAQTAGDFSTAQTFVYLYLPVVIVVLYGLVWAWVDLDVKRLEPFFRMSSDEGALLKDSIHLHYPFEFLAHVPIKAAIRRHWSVLIAGLSAMLVFWAVTPLTGAIFGVSSTIVNTTVPISKGGFLDPSTQVQVLNGNFFNDAYTIIWLGAPMPKYTRRDVVLHPYFIANSDVSDLQSGELKASTVAYFTNLTCTPAILSNMTESYVTYSNGKGCSINLPTAQFNEAGFGTGSYSLSYDGWFPSGWRGGSLSEGDCPETFSNTFLAAWAHTYPDPTESSPNGYVALGNTTCFCEAHYYSQKVNATLSLPDHAVLDIVSNGPQEEMSLNLFNTTNFHYLLSNAVAALSESDTGDDGSFGSYGADLPDRTILDISARLANLSVRTSLDISEYVVGPGMASIEELQNMTKLSKAYQRVHQLLFSTAMSRVMLPNVSNDDGGKGQYQEDLTAVRVDYTFTILAQAALSIITSMALLLAFLCGKRHIYLDSDPSSIQSIMRIVAGSQLLASHLGILENRHQNNTDRPVQSRLRLIQDSSTHSRLEITNDSSIDLEGSANLSTDGSGAVERQKLFKPLEMRLSAGLIWIAVHICLLTTLIFLYVQTRKLNGLELPSNNEFRRRLLLSYLPIAVSTLLEPCWVLLTRTRAVFQPFHELSKQNATAKVSIQTKYTSMPPQLILPRAFKSGHIILAALCLVAILANILSVALSEIFQTRLTSRTESAMFEYTLQSNFSEIWPNSNYTSNDYLYTLRDSLTNVGTMPPWAGEDFFFLPFQEITMLQGKTGVEREAVTRGFGFNMQCFEEEVVYHAESVKGGALSIPFIADTGRSKIYKSRVFLADTATFTFSELPHYPAAVEWSNYQEMNPSCTGCGAFGWFRNDVYFNKSQSKFIGCQPRLCSAEFLVRVDNESRVISSARETQLEHDMKPYLGSIARQYDIIDSVFADFWSEWAGPNWHNLTFASDWTNYLVKITDSDAIVDPLEPVPEFNHVAPIIQRIYNQYFAIKLALNPQWFEKSPASDRKSVRGSYLWTEDRVFFAPSAFSITIAILSVDLIVAVALYSSRLKDKIYEAPTCLASIIKMVGHSFIVAEMGTGMSDLPDVRYGYGKYLGTDGKIHVGIERSPLVVPIGE